MKYYHHFLLLLLIGCSGIQKNRVDLLITSASLIEISSGNILEGKVIAIAGDTIHSVFDEALLGTYSATETINAEGKFIIPGLWDVHMHFGGGDSLIQENKNLLNLYLAHGITSVRDCAADLSPSVLQWREEIAKGELLGPTIFTSGPKLEGYKSVWVGDIEIGTTEELNRAIDSLQRMNVDFIKITDNTLSPELYLQALMEAKRRGIRTSGHIPFSLSLFEVSAAGLGSVEHLTYLLKAGSTREREISAAFAAGKITYREALPLLVDSYNEQIADSVFLFMAQQGTAVTPTLTISKTLAYLDQDDHTHDDYLNYIGPGLRKTYVGRVERAARDDASAIAMRHRVFEKSKSILKQVHASGVMILAGTDAGYLNSFVYPGISLHQELALFVDAGLSPLQALQTSILNGPKFLGKTDRFGDIQQGHQADLVILNANPLHDIRSTEDIFGVMTKGNWLDRARLDQLLKETRKHASGL